MPSWNELLGQLESLADDQKNPWHQRELTGALGRVGQRRGDRNVIFYASAFLQKPGAPGNAVSISHEEINGLMAVMYGMDWSKNLTLLLHTPGGVTNAAETIVAYLTSKFSDIEVIVPTFAMSAGTMISLAANRIVMGRQSQLGPIDPQISLPTAGRNISARAVVEQFDRVKEEISEDLTAAHAWVPILQSVGPSLLQEAQNALDYSEDMVASWIEARMLNGCDDASEKAAAIAHHFNDASTHKSHGRRIDREEAKQHGVVIEDLEDDQDLQEDVLTAYHLMTILFEKSPAAKVMYSNAGRQWAKNLA